MKVTDLPELSACFCAKDDFPLRAPPMMNVSFPISSLLRKVGCIVEQVNDRASCIKCNFRKRRARNTKLPVMVQFYAEGKTKQGLDRPTVHGKQDSLIFMICA